MFYENVRLNEKSLDLKLKDASYNLIRRQIVGIKLNEFSYYTYNSIAMIDDW